MGNTDECYICSLYRLSQCTSKHTYALLTELNKTKPTKQLLFHYRIEFDTRHIVVQALVKRLNYMKIATCTEIKSNSIDKFRKQI